MAYTDYIQWKTTLLTETPLLSVVIPAYNEADRIIPTIGAIASYLCDQVIPWELIIVDDGSTDKTVDLIVGLGMTNLRLLRAAHNEGKGSAVRRGMLAARGKYLLFADADNSTPIEELDKLLVVLTDGDCQVAVGSRAVAGASEQHKQLLRRIVSGCLRLVVRHLLHLPVIDTQCGFKLFSRQAAKFLYARQLLTGFSFDLELLYLATKFGYPVAEVPVTWIDAPGSKVDTVKEIRRFLRDVVVIRLNDWRGMYESTVKRQRNAAQDRVCGF